jgi:hypothetical protein
MAVESGELGEGEVGCRSDGEGTAAGEAFAPASGESRCTGNTDSTALQSQGPLLLSCSVPDVRYVHRLDGTTRQQVIWSQRRRSAAGTAARVSRPDGRIILTKTKSDGSISTRVTDNRLELFSIPLRISASQGRRHSHDTSNLPACKRVHAHETQERTKMRKTLLTSDYRHPKLTTSIGTSVQCTAVRGR